MTKRLLSWWKAISRERPFYQARKPLRIRCGLKQWTDEVINTLREDKGLLHNRYDMSAFARSFPESIVKGNYCTEYGFRVDTDKHAFLLRCNPTKGDYNFYCYCYVKDWLASFMFIFQITEEKALTLWHSNSLKRFLSFTVTII